MACVPESPELYNIQEMQKLLCYSANTEWEMMIFLAGLYGLRRGEITGLRWRNVNLEHNVLKVVEQQPYDIDRDELVLTEMAPPKSVGRALPITAITRPWFEKQLQLCRKQRHLQPNHYVQGSLFAYTCQQ